MVGRKGGGIAVRVDNCSHSLTLEAVCESLRYAEFFLIIVGLYIHLYFLVMFNCLPMTHNKLDANAYLDTAKPL